MSENAIEHLCARGEEAQHADNGRVYTCSPSSAAGRTAERHRTDADADGGRSGDGRTSSVTRHPPPFFSLQRGNSEYTQTLNEPPEDGGSPESVAARKEGMKTSHRAVPCLELLESWGISDEGGFIAQHSIAQHSIA